MKRMRLVEAWLTDRLHDTGSASSIDTLLFTTGSSLPLSSLLASTLVTNLQPGIGRRLFRCATQKLTLHGGLPPPSGATRAVCVFCRPPAWSARITSSFGRIQFGSATYRPTQRSRLQGKWRAGQALAFYFRTSLYDYQRCRARFTYQAPVIAQHFSGFHTVEQSEPAGRDQLRLLLIRKSLSLYWAPRASKIFDFQGSYSRSDLKSNIGYLDPGTLSQQMSRYRDNSHTATASH